ncbi:MAG: bifunctional riboflavin kinase/FAD synthetase [Actinomycetota bacterium]
MKTLFGRDALAVTEQGSAVTIGTFDGVHVGHRALIARTLDASRAQELESVVVTWDRHPAATLRPDAVPPLLTTPERKVELIEECGVDTLAILPFDRELSSWPPERFVEDVLVSGLGARALVVGDGWRFGRKATGDVALLRRLGEEMGFSVRSLPLAEVSGGPASSTRARDAVAAGDMELARAIMGRPFDLDGEVVRGDDRGVALGFPTANIAIDEAYAHPPTGVYAGRAGLDEEIHAAAINVGVNPTFGVDEADVRPRIEAYLLDFSGDLYGRVLRVEFHKRLRDERKFDSVEGLIDQIARDVEATRALTC